MYSTYDFAEEGKKAGVVTSSSKSILIVSIIAYCIQFFNITMFSRTEKGCNTCFEIILLTIFLGGEIALLIILVVMYSNTLSAMRGLNIDMFRFAVDN